MESGHHKSTRMTNEREALKIANAVFTALVRGEAGIGEPKRVPMLRAFREDFITAVRAEKPDKPKTVQFYTYSFDSLLKYEPLAEARLDSIDERLVQRFTVWALARNCETDEERTCSVATVNRWRATLRKALRMARRWKLIQTVPEIPRLKGERERSFVFTEALRKKYGELAPEPLNSFVQFSCEIGICEGEIIDLVKADVHMTEKADEWGTTAICKSGKARPNSVSAACRSLLAPRKSSRRGWRNRSLISCSPGRTVSPRFQLSR